MPPACACCCSSMPPALECICIALPQLALATACACCCSRVPMLGNAAARPCPQLSSAPACECLFLPMLLHSTSGLTAKPALANCCKGPPLQVVRNDAVALSGICKVPISMRFRGGDSRPILPAKAPKSCCWLRNPAASASQTPASAGFSVKPAGSRKVLEMLLLSTASARPCPSLRVQQLALCKMSVTADNSRAKRLSTTPSSRTGASKGPRFACAAACECPSLREQQLASAPACESSSLRKTPPGCAYFGTETELAPTCLGVCPKNPARGGYILRIGQTPRATGASSTICLFFMCSSTSKQQLARATACESSSLRARSDP